MKNYAYSRKRRQLQHLVKLLKTAAQQNTVQAAVQVKTIGLKIKKLVAELKFVFQGFQLKKILGPAAFLLGMTLPGQVAAQQFAPPVSSPFDLVTENSYYVFQTLADLDNDGDLDMIGLSDLEQIIYYENTGNANAAQFATPVVNTFGIPDFSEGVNFLPTFEDLDADGDFDLIVGTYDNTNYSWSIAYLENTGSATNPQFGAIQSNPFGITVDEGDYVMNPKFVDLDNDGDLDMLVTPISANTYGTVFKYYENTGTASAPQFAAPQQNLGLSSEGSFFFGNFADMDLDGDYDLIGAVYDFYTYASYFSYFENTGSASSPQFAAEVQNPFGLSLGYSDILYPSFVDIDNDGDIDILGGQYYYESETLAFTYFENTDIVGIGAAPPAFDLQIFPNPAHDFITIQTDEVLQDIAVLDLQGRVLHTFTSTNVVSLQNFPAGNYLLKITNAGGKIVLNKIQKQ